MTQFNKAYVASETPPIPYGTKYAVLFWGYIIFVKNKLSAQNQLNKLPYYQREDAMVFSVKRGIICNPAEALI